LTVSSRKAYAMTQARVRSSFDGHPPSSA
jgi:hypothetical protein